MLRLRQKLEYSIQEFACARCGNCCRGDGYVRVTPDDIIRMAMQLSITVTEFQSAYTRPPEILAQAEVGDLWLLDKPGPQQECIMLEDNLCKVHRSKPVQCVGFPMKWRTPDIMDYCEGMKS